MSAGHSSDSGNDSYADSDETLVRVRRPNGNEVLLRVPNEHLQRVMDLANGEFGDPSILLGGPELAEEHGRELDKDRGSDPGQTGSFGDGRDARYKR